MDQYDEAIAYLRVNPEEVYAAWTTPYEHPAGCLFTFCRAGQLDDSFVKTPDGYAEIGCLTQVKHERNFNGESRYVARTEELTKAIRADDRIPTMPKVRGDNTHILEKLEVCAEWQRRIDKELGRV